LATRRNQNKNGTGNPSYNFNTKNQITSMTYDAAGNIINDGLHTYTYDAENRLIKVDNGSVATYSYDAFGHRVATNVVGTAREFIFDANGHMIGMMRSATPRTWDRGELYAGGWHVASYVNGSTYFNHADWLGTVRVRTGPTGAVIANESYASLPFGDCLRRQGSIGPVKHFRRGD
jgi:YD repeat-containing protein